MEEKGKTLTPRSLRWIRNLSITQQILSAIITLTAIGGFAILLIDPLSAKPTKRDTNELKAIATNQQETADDIRALVEYLIESKEQATGRELSIGSRERVEELLGELIASSEPVKRGAVLQAQAGELQAASDLLANHAEELDRLSIETADTFRQAAALSTDIFREIQYLERAIELDPDLPADLNSLGMAYRGIGEIALAREKYLAALEASKKVALTTGDRSSVDAAIEGNLAILEMDEGNYAEALIRLERTLAVFRELGQSGHIANQYVNICSALINSGQAEQALEPCNRALDIFSKIGDASGFHVSLSNLGSAHVLLGNYNTALSYIESNHSHVQEHRPDRHPHVHIDFANALRAMGSNEDAAVHYIEAARLFEEGSQFFNASSMLYSAYDVNQGSLGSGSSDLLFDAIALKPKWEQFDSETVENLAESLDAAYANTTVENSQINSGK